MLKNLLLELAFLVIISQSTGVVILDDSNYTQFVKTNPYVFIKFYAPWCGHCKKMIPEYEKLAEASVGKPYVIAKLDSADNKKVSEEVGVEGFPTLKFIVNGYAVNYEGGRTADDIYQWIQSFLASKVSTITEDELKEKIGKEIFIVAQGVKEADLNTFEIAHASGSGISFYYLNSPDFKVTLYLLNSKTFEYESEKIDVESLISWATDSSLPIVVPLNSKERVGTVFENKKKLPTFTLLKDADLTKNLNGYLEFCQENKGKIICSVAEPSDQVFSGITNYLKYSKEGQSLLIYFGSDLKSAYYYPESLAETTKDSLNQFLSDVSEGKIEQSFEAKPEPPKQIKYENVLKLTNQNYEDTLANNKYVLVEYYSPNCGHCIRFAPIYDEFAGKLIQESSPFLLAAVDLTAQKQISDKVNVSGYPTFKFYINGNEIEYQGGRDADSMHNFMKEASEAKLLIASSANDIPQPAVAVYGIDASSPLQFLPILFTKYPIYHITAESGFKVELIEKAVREYSETSDLRTVADWLNKATEPVLVDIAVETPPKKLSKAFEKQIPLLLFMNRGQRSLAEGTLQFLTGYCGGKTQLVCGYAHKDSQASQHFESWLADPVKDKNRLALITTVEYKKYLYEGDTNTLTNDAVDDFVAKVLSGEIREHVEQVQEESQEESAQAAQEPQPTQPVVVEQTVELTPEQKTSEEL